MLGELEQSRPFNVKVIEDGREIVRPDVVQAVVNLGTLGQLGKIRKLLEREHLEGKLDRRSFDATDQANYADFLKDAPNTPWAKATLLNHGPNTVYVAINKDRPFHPLLKGESEIIDFIKADRRIEYIEYYCDPGETASLDARGKY